MRMTLRAVAAALLFTAASIQAHHAFSAEYDEKKLITVTGIVTSIKWTNPHAWLHVDGNDESGKAASWSFEMGSPGGLISRGWKRTDLKKGDRITVDVFRAKDGGNTANARIVTLPDRRKLFGGFNSTPGAPPAK